MPAGVTWARYLSFTAAAMLSMFAGAQAVHLVYHPLDIYDIWIDRVTSADMCSAQCSILLLAQPFLTMLKVSKQAVARGVASVGENVPKYVTNIYNHMDMEMWLEKEKEKVKMSKEANT